MFGSGNICLGPETYVWGPRKYVGSGKISLDLETFADPMCKQSVHHHRVFPFAAAADRRATLAICRRRSAHITPKDTAVPESVNCARGSVSEVPMFRAISPQCAQNPGVKRTIGHGMNANRLFAKLRQQEGHPDHETKLGNSKIYTGNEQRH